MPDEQQLPIGGQIALSPDQIAQAVPAELPIGGQVRLSTDQVADARKQSGQLDPLQDFSPDQLAELQKQSPEFSILHEYAARPDLQEQPGMNQKIADAYHLGRVNGSFLDKYQGESTLGTVGNVLKGAAGTVWDTAKGFGKQAWNYAQALATPVGAMVTAPFTTPETTEGMFSQAQRQVAENIAGTETSLFGLGKTISAGGDVVARKLGLDKPLKYYTPEEKQAVLFEELRDIKKQQAISKGQGPILGSVGSEIVSELQKEGVPVRPEEVQKTAAGDPFSWYAMGKAFHGLEAAVPPALAARAARATQVAGDIAAKVGGKTVETAADLTQLGADAAAKVAPVTGAAIGAVKGAELHGPAGLVVGAGAGYKAGQKIAEGLENVSEKIGRVSDIGEQIAGAKPVVSPIAQLGKDVLQAAPGAAVELGKGAAFDLGLVAATSEESPDEKAGVGMGTVFGALGAGKRIGGRVLSGQIIAPRNYGSGTVVPSSGNFPIFDAMHSDAVRTAEPGVVARLNATRAFIKGAAPDTDIFLAKDPATLENALKQAGLTDAQAALYASQKGFFTTSIPDSSGNPRRVIIARNIEAAPHEAFHAVQDVLGEGANREIDKLVYDAYKDQWENEGSKYARRFSQFDPNKTWQENILDLSGWGRSEAAEKMARDAYNKLSAQTGAEPNPADVHQLASAEWDRVLAEATKRNPGVPLDKVSENAWRDVLSPQEAEGTANRYLARELAAENFDAVFKHNNTGNEKLIPRLANIVGNLVSAMGGEPLAGRESEVGRVPLKFDVTKKVGEVLPKPEISPAGETAPVSTSRTTGIPATPEARQQAADDARTIAASAPTSAPTTGGTGANLPATKSPREILGSIAEAIAQRAGVKINYLSAPDEPAAATTSSRPVRRAIIEAFRSMPTAARALWEKTFFPERVLKLKGDRYQVLGWAPEVFASNAHKLAQTLADTGVASPYEIDPKNRTFTEKGWRDLFSDVKTFVENQGAGRTGAGERLVVPSTVTEAGFTAPKVEGPGKGLDQRRADFINMMFNFKLPETPRITSGKLPLNIAGQEVSAATEPGRVSVPVRPRGEFAGEAAEKLGISGRKIMEVNPVRAEIEAAAQKAGIPMPDMIEAVQRLALEHINDVQLAPEAPQFRGNTLTLTAGFQPEGPVNPKELKTPAVRDTEGRRIFTASHHSLAEAEARASGVDIPDGGLERGFLTHGGDFVSWSKAADMIRSGEIKGDVFKAAAQPGVVRYQPGEISGELDKIFRQTTQEFSDYMKAFPGMTVNRAGGSKIRGLTGYAYELGSKARTVDDLNAFKLSQKTLQEAGAAAMKNKDLPTAMDLYLRAQVPREAYEFATGEKIDTPGEAGSAGSIEKLRKEFPGYEPPLPGGEPLGQKAAAQFQPLTEAGKDLEKRGLSFERVNYGAGLLEYVVRNQKGKQIAILSVSRQSPELAKAETVHVDDKYRGQGIAEALYREMATDLQEAGVKTLTGDVIHPAPLKIRNKLFGQPKSLTDIPISNAWGVTAKEAVHEIPPDVQFQPGEKNPVEDLAKDYAKTAGIGYVPPTGHVQYNRDLAKRLAAEYDSRTHAPDDPEVKKSYDAFTKETLDQFKKIQEAGYTLEPVSSPESPYRNGMDALRDVNENKHLFFNTSETFGQEGQNLENQRMLEPAGIEIDGKPMVINDIFRAVHDFFGHARRGLSFGPRGEFNAWREHSALYSEAAQGALAAETIGQTAWTQLGPHLLNEKGELIKPGEPGFAPRETRPYAEQKNIVMPPGLISEAKGQFLPRNHGLVGEVNDDLDTQSLSFPASDLAEARHEVLGYKRNTNWRWINGTTYWWGEPSETQIDAVTEHIKNKGGFVRANKFFSDHDFTSKAFNDMYDRSHGLKAPKEGQFQPAPFDQKRFDDQFGGLPFDEYQKKLAEEKSASAPKTYIVRHGSTSMNAADPDKDKIRGHKDVPLNAKGREEARSTAKELSGSGISTIITSDLSRAKDTADEIAKKTGAEVITDPDLRPWKFGPTIEGKATSDMLPRINKLVENPDQRPPGGESFNEFKERFIGAFHRAQDAYPDKNTAIVTHYRGTKLLEAWRATGTDNDDVDRAVFEKYDPSKEPGFFEVVDKSGAQFQPQKRQGEKGEKGEEWELRRAPGVKFSKAWILPNGTPMQLGGQWHHEALNENPDLLKKYKRQWIRVNIDAHEQGKQILLEGPKPNKDQRAALEDVAFHYKFPVVNDDGRLAIESTGEFQPGAQFQPAKKEEWEFRRAPGVKFSKAWILPNGTPMQLGGQWHHEALNENPDLLKKYGVPATDSSEENRVAALKKGFARVNYDTHNGLLTVEARASDWRKLKDAVSRMVEANLNSIDKMTVHLMNPSVTKVADSDTGILFDKDTPAEKMASIPFLGDVGSSTAQFQPFEDKGFESELDAIRAGKSGGQTFTPSGAVWTPKNPKVDIVSLASVNVPQGDLTKENFLDAVKPYQDLLDDPNTVAGVFSFSKEGIPTVSIDVNAVVPQKYRDNTVKFAKENQQRAIWDVAKSEVVDTGGSGNTRLNKPEELLDVLDPLLRGKPVSVDDVIKQNEAPGAPVPEQEGLPGIGQKEMLSTGAIGSMTKAELAQQYPEAVIARKRGEPLSSNITESPLAKQAGSREAAVSAFARRLVEFANEYKNNPVYQSGAKWYKDFVPQLKKQFGEHAQLMAELLAATSPRTDVASNYAYALDALEGFKSGRFKKTIAKFEEGLAKLENDNWQSWYRKEEKAGNIPNPPAEPTPAAFLEHWISKYGLKPTQSNGKLYGTHSIRILQVFARRWNDLNTGPKTRTFVSNLLGTGHDATIDVWADRTMRRLGYAGFEDRWRILPQNTAPVSDADFYFSQEAFAQAAKELGMQPDALQGALWFAEKDHWAKNGWARLDLGSFQTELAKTSMLERGIKQRSAVSKAEAKVKPVETPELFNVEPRNIRR